MERWKSDDGKAADRETGGLVGGLLWGLLLIRRGESDPAVRLDYEQAADQDRKAILRQIS